MCDLRDQWMEKETQTKEETMKDTTGDMFQAAKMQLPLSMIVETASEGAIRTIDNALADADAMDVLDFFDVLSGNQ
jgi:hypothetical protein